MIVKTADSQMGSPAAAEEGGEAMGGGRGESGERSEVQARSTFTSTAPKARSRSREVATLDEAPRISLRQLGMPWVGCDNQLTTDSTLTAVTSICKHTSSLLYRRLSTMPMLIASSEQRFYQYFESIFGGGGKLTWQQDVIISDRLVER